MMEDVNAGIAWVLKRIRHYGGDPSRVYLVGQSCGAQLSMMCLVTQACCFTSLPRCTYSLEVKTLGLLTT